MPRKATVTGRVYAFRLPPHEEKSFETAAKNRGMSFSALARELVLRGLKDV